MQFISANDDLMANKIQKKAKEIEDKNEETAVYFPFNHGDAIQKQRAYMAENQKEELLKNYMKHSKEKEDK